MEYINMEITNYIDLFTYFQKYIFNLIVSYF